MKVQRQSDEPTAPSRIGETRTIAWVSFTCPNCGETVSRTEADDPKWIPGGAKWEAVSCPSCEAGPWLLWLTVENWPVYPSQ